MISAKKLFSMAVAACMVSASGVSIAEDGVARISDRASGPRPLSPAIQRTSYFSLQSCAPDGSCAAEPGHGNTGAGEGCDTSDGCGLGAGDGHDEGCGNGDGNGEGCGNGCSADHSGAGEGCVSNSHSSGTHGLFGNSRDGLFGDSGSGNSGGLFGHSGSGNSGGLFGSHNGLFGNRAGGRNSSGTGLHRGKGANGQGSYGVAHVGSFNGLYAGPSHNGRIARPQNNRKWIAGCDASGRKMMFCSDCHCNPCQCNGSHHGTGNGNYGDGSLFDCLFGWSIPSGNCGQGLPLFGKYHTTYADRPDYVNPADTQLYGAGQYGMPITVPLAPTVNYQYNYSSGMPASRITTIGTWNPQTSARPLNCQSW